MPDLFIVSFNAENFVLADIQLSNFVFWMGITPIVSGYYGQNENKKANQVLWLIESQF